MKRLLDMMGMTIGGWIGWFVGAPAGIFMAFVVGMVGTGLGLYATRKISKQLLP